MTLDTIARSKAMCGHRARIEKYGVDGARLRGLVASCGSVSPDGSCLSPFRLSQVGEPVISPFGDYDPRNGFVCSQGPRKVCRRQIGITLKSSVDADKRPPRFRCFVA